MGKPLAQRHHGGYNAQLTIGSYTSACVHRDMKHTGSLESTKDA